MSIDLFAQLIADCGVVEVRHFNQGIDSALIDDPDKLRQAVNLDGNIYTTLNRPDRVANNRFGDKAISDSQIVRIVRIPFDFDPVRSPGIASTQEELDKTEAKAMEFVRYMRLHGWPEPLIAMSGNGWHVQYRTNLPATDETKALMKPLYQGLKEKFSDEFVSFDATVRSPAQILRLYGSINRKGIATDERPHRKTFHLLIEQWHQVRLHQVERLAKRFEKPKPVIQPREFKPVEGSGDFNTLDVVRWFTAHGLYEHHIEDRKHSVVCPWEHEHSEQHSNDSIIFEADNGWPGFHCKHSHCEGRNIRDVIALFGNADQFCSRRFKHESA